MVLGSIEYGIVSTKERPADGEVYESYWPFTMALTDMYGQQFSICLRVIKDFIDKYKDKLQKIDKEEFRKYYVKLQDTISEIMGYRSKDPNINSRKIINQFVKLGFISPYLKGYHILTDKFLKTHDEDTKKFLFSLVFYEKADFFGSVTSEPSGKNCVKFIVDTLAEHETISKDDLAVLMTIVDPKILNRGAISGQEFNRQKRYIKHIKFSKRKYNQVSHLWRFLQYFTGVDYDSKNKVIRFVIDKDFDISEGRDPVKQHLYRVGLIEQSKEFYDGNIVCYFTKNITSTDDLIASHIKPFRSCSSEREAYGIDNGLLLSKIVDKYFDKFKLTFDTKGNPIFSNAVPDEIVELLKDYKLDNKVLNRGNCKEYIRYHNIQFEKMEKDI